MRTRSTRSARTDGLLAVAAMATLMWLVEIVDVVAAGRLDAYGIEPRTSDGLVGVVTSPFLHAGFGHLLSNTLPFLGMGVLIALSGLARVLKVTGLVALVSGAGTWLTAAPNSITVGASGIVFGYATYLLSRGLFDRDRRALNLLVGAVVAVVWGGALLGGLLPQEGISWQAHLFGAIGGLLAARLLRAPRRSAPPAARAGGAPLAY